MVFGPWSSSTCCRQFFSPPIIYLRRRQIVAGGWSLQIAGMLAGIALVCYAGALIFTEVVRATLFYYLTPIWSTLLARIVLSEPITAPRWGTIGLGLIGAVDHRESRHRDERRLKHRRLDGDRRRAYLGCCSCLHEIR